MPYVGSATTALFAVALAAIQATPLLDVSLFHVSPSPITQG